MDYITEHLREFNREYLSTPADRRQLGETLINGALTVLVIIAAGVVLVLL
ncbi:MAG: hypothetical protein NTY36_01400 [Deltaproteobacteria bacterium]|nr:hypothetical protein [Deltaproteobacteria bacterium]